MNSKCDNIEIMINDEADDLLKELIDSRKDRYQNQGLMEGSEIVFDYAHKINPNRDG